MQFKVKQLLAGFLTTLTLTSHAELPKTLKVYTAYPGSLPFCKAVFTEYDRAYGTESQIIIKTGTTGMMAMKAMQAEPEFSVLCPTGVSDHVVNKITYPGNDATFDDLKIVSVLATLGPMFVTGNGNKFATLPEMLRQGKEITVGYHSQGLKTAAAEVLKDSKVIWVAHKSSLEAMAALNDGSLDLYPDGAGLLSLVSAGKLKSLGRINAPDTVPGIDLSAVYPSAAKTKLIMGISVSSKNSTADLKEFETRIKKVQSSDGVQEAIRAAGYKPQYMSSKEAEVVIQTFKSKYVVQ
jgi:tripartite-type tricarboxylate transporter receptor subunit TctC